MALLKNTAHFNNFVFKIREYILTYIEVLQIFIKSQCCIFVFKIRMTGHEMNDIKDYINKNLKRNIPKSEADLLKYLSLLLYTIKQRTNRTDTLSEPAAKDLKIKRLSQS